MALSGSFYTNVGSHWRLSIEWTATQDISSNQSLVTAKMYWANIDSYGAINSSATKTSAINHDSNAWSTESAAGMASLSSGQKKLINTYSFTLTHNPDGTKSFTLDGYFSAQVTLGSTYYDTINLTQTTFTLNTIPRASTLTSGQSWTAGGSTTFNISRASSTFTHDINVKISDGASTWHDLGTLTGIGTSYTWTPDNADMTTIFDQLNNDTTNWNQSTSITLTTKDGSGNVIGSNSYGGTVSSPAASTTTASANFNIGDSVTIPITRAYSSFIHTIKIYLGSTLIHTSPSGQTTSYTWTPTSTEITNMYNTTPSSNTISSKIEIYTYYDSSTTDQIVRSAWSKTGTATVKSGSSNPAFTTISYIDNNTTTANLTNPYKGTYDPFIIQNQSLLRAQVLSANKAAPIHGATSITKYIATFNGATITVNSPFSTDINFDFNAIDATSNLTLSITAFDTRGNSTTVTKTVNIVPWSLPVVKATAKRTDGFQNETILKVSGSISPLNVNGTNVNGLNTNSMTYQFAQAGQSYNAATVFTGQSLTMPNYAVSDVTLNGSTGLDNLSAWSVKVVVADQLSSKTTYITVSAGQPLMFIDATNKAVGINQFPDDNVPGLYLTGKIKANGFTFLEEASATLPATAGWYRIATSVSGVGLNLAEFDIRGYIAGHHSVTKLVSGISYSDNTNSVILNCLGHTYWTDGLTQARVVYNDTDYTNNYAYLEIYNPNAVSIAVVVRKTSGFGWSLISPDTAGSIPTGYTSKTINMGTFESPTIVTPSIKLTQSDTYGRQAIWTTGTDPNHYGLGVAVGGGGATIIGGGEAAATVADGMEKAAVNSSATSEQLYLASDNHVWIQTNVNTSYDSRKEFRFGSDGNLYFPTNGLIDQDNTVYPGLNASWINYGGGYSNVAYIRDRNNIVHITGLIKGGNTAAGTTLFTLGSGFIPGSSQIFTCMTAGYYGGTATALCRITVNSSGAVTGTSNLDAGWTSLAGISFSLN